ncbi:hypothetical protein [Marinobacterium aestuarii]|nr:hypothetical protein [Marinobacterium aestuarii]
MGSSKILAVQHREKIDRLGDLLATLWAGTPDMGGTLSTAALAQAVQSVL